VFELLLVVGALIAAIAAWKAYQEKQRRNRLAEKRSRLIDRYHDENVVNLIMDSKIWQGMSQEQLIESWGEPAAKDQKIYKTKITETFKYNQTSRTRFGSRVKVENGIVVGWEQK